MKTVTVIMTCFNRREKTLNCISSLCTKNPQCQFKFIIVDDHSSDGTVEAIQKLQYDLVCLPGTGKLYWAGGMRKGIDYFLDQKEYMESDYVLFVNDDVDFYPEAIDRMVEVLEHRNRAVLVGNCCDEKGSLTYGAVCFRKMWNKPLNKPMYYLLSLEESHREADTFNCNCVLIPSGVVRKIGNFDTKYTHHLADFDYGFQIKKYGYKIYGTSFFVGTCCYNNRKGTWVDTTLSRKERFLKKEQPKGLPRKEWYYFLKKNFGLVTAVRYSLTPYIRILLKR